MLSAKTFAKQSVFHYFFLFSEVYNDKKIFTCRFCNVSDYSFLLCVYSEKLCSR